MSRVRLVWAWGPSSGPTACALAGRRCALRGWRKGVPGGGAFRRFEGRLQSGAPSPPTARPPGGLSGPATHVLWARVCGCGGPTLSPWLARPAGAACCGGGGGPSPGGLACHHCEGRLVSGAVPPPAAPPLGRAAGVPRPVCPRCGWCGRGDPAPAPQRSPLRAGVARCGGGGRASPGGVPYAVVGGVWGQALPLARLPALLVGCRGPLPMCCGRGCAGVGALHRPRGSCALRGVARHGGGGGRLGSGAPSSRQPALWAGCRGPLARLWVCAACVVSVRCVLWCVVSLFVCPSGAPLSGALLRCCARRVLAVPPSLLASLARLLVTSCFFRGLAARYPFPYSSLARPPPWHAGFPCLRLAVCLGVSPASLVSVPGSSSLSPVGPCETKEGWGYVGHRRLGTVTM